VVKKGESLEREAEVLRALDFPGLPRVQRHDGEGLALSPVPGQPLWISMQRSLRPRRAHASHLASAGRWLGRFHAATRSGDEVAVHGDFWARNILFQGDEVSGVVDWEHGALCGTPWKDLFTLPLLFVRDAPRWIARRPARHAASDIIDAYFRAYVAEAGGDVRSLREELERWASAYSG
jgi:aminoglycoside phosphotransferase (APT) family kinase protein